MKEELLQFIWRLQYFNQQELITETGEPLQILLPGELNTHQGPDFLNAQVRIGNTLMAGSVELHVIASDWKRHAHEEDIHYRNVILHVVWENDRNKDNGAIKDPPPERPIPLLVLQHRVPKLLLGQYEKWMKSPAFIPCERVIAKVPTPLWAGWKQQLLNRRLQRRTLHIRSCLEQNQQDWEETTWWLMARNFGLPVNGMAFEAIGRSLPIRLLARRHGEPFSLEALLLGQAGLLEAPLGSAYPQSLQKEYRYLQKKHRLSPIPIPLSFLRMRPAHFPTIRLAQLAALLSRRTAWFAAIRAAASRGELIDWLQVEAAGYWVDHYMLDREPTSIHPKKLGKFMINSLLINTFVPLLFAVGSLRGESACREKAFRWLQEAEAEENTLLSGWTRIGVDNRNAADSQALLELKAHYCGPKKCLDCAIGQALLGRQAITDSRDR
jgi:hypothetical protein